MKRNNIMVAFVAIIAAFAATENANAQSEVANRLAKKAQVYWASEGPGRLETPTKLASQKTFFYDNKKLEISVPAIRENDRQDSLVLSWPEDIRRNSTSGWALGVDAGYLQMAENGSPLVGLGLRYVGRRLAVGTTIGGAISKYNAESSKAGQSFITAVFLANVGLVVYRFPLGGYDNQGEFIVGYQMGYILDKNENKAGETTYETPNEIVTTSDYFYVEGNSFIHSVYGEVLFSLKHMGVSSIGLKVYGGFFNRYYEQGSRRKAMFGASVSLYFSGAKKRSDKDISYLRQTMERGDFQLANEVVNQLRATVK